MQALSPLADKLKEHHTRLVFVGSSTVDQMEEFMRSPTVLMSGELYSDPTTSLYKTFHMKRGRFRSLVMPIWNSVSRYGWSGAVEGKQKYIFFTYNWHVFLNLVAYYYMFVDVNNFECCSLWMGAQGNNIKKRRSKLFQTFLSFINLHVPYSLVLQICD